MSTPTGEFRILRTDYLYVWLDGMLQLGSRVVESVEVPGVFMRETTVVLSLYFSTYEFTRRSSVLPKSK